MPTLKHAWKSGFEYTHKEVVSLLVISAVSGGLLFLFFSVTGLSSMGDVDGFIFFVLAFLVLYLVFIASQKMISGYLGYSSFYKLWPYSIFISLFVAFYSLALMHPYALIPFLYFGTLMLEPVPRLRLGKFRHGLNVKDLLIMGLTGPLVLLLLTLAIIQPLYFATEAEIFRMAIYVVAFILFFSSLPLPYSNGINIFLKSRNIWAFYFFSTLALLLLLISFNIVLYIAAFIIGILFGWALRKYVKTHL